MNLAERIKALQEALVAARDLLTEKSNLIGDESHEDQDTLMAEVETLSTEIESKEKSLDTLIKAEKSLMQNIKPNSYDKANNNEAPGIIKHHGLPESKEPFDLLVKQATCEFLGHHRKQNPMQIAEELYGKDQRVQAVVKTATNGADTTTSGWASELVANDTQGFLEALKSVSVYAELASMGVGINFGNYGSVTIPRRGATGGLSGAFVGEQGVIPVKQGAVGSQTLNRHKMAVISVFSKELARSSTPQIEAVIRQGMMDDTAQALDTALLDNSAAVGGVRPAGLGNATAWGTTTAAGTAGGGQAAVSADLKGLINVLTTAKAGQRPVLIMNSATKVSLGLQATQLGEYLFRDEISRSVLLGIPVIASTHVPTGTVWIVDASYFAHAFGAMEFDVSDTATLTMANADGVAPTQAGDATGALGTQEQVVPDGGISVHGGTSGAAYAGYEAQSMYQTWQTAVRMVMPISWGMIMPGVVSNRTGVTW